MKDIQDAADKTFGTGMGEWFDWAHGNTENRKVLPNVWLGVSTENQQAADERIPLILKTPAAVRFISYEPALEKVNFDEFLRCPKCSYTQRDAGINMDHHLCEGKIPDRIHQIIIGAESGPKARPFDMDWARSVRDQCKMAGVPFFFKQRNGWIKREIPKGEDVFCYLAKQFLSHGDAEFYWTKYKSAVDENGKKITKFSMPKLDGQIWDQYPEIWRPK